ncbi:MAG: type I 3-dehydroquinate dehydratase [Chloroflexota bacterium]|jgi:3-dehydroquinate dehydratase type I|nr:type I 3-dehydroquinate dehydratase [Candidatus Sulfotelmatobacter sp.]
MPRICASVFPQTIPEALKLIERAENEGLGLIEIRLDSLENYDGLSKLGKHGKIQKIATNRLTHYHGKFLGTEVEQKQVLLTAAKTGFDYVDIELASSNLKEFTTQASEQGAKVIVSFHDFDGVLKLTELGNILEREIDYGADVCKIITTAKRIEDNLTLLNFTVAASKRTNIICFAMGEHGKISRLLSPLFGGFLTFAALESGLETATGQLTVQDMRITYKLLGL